MKERIPKYIHIKKRIKECISQGLFTDKLPGERVLAKDFDVSYMTVRKAITELVEEGILHKFTTKGTFVSNRKMSPKVTSNVGFFLDEKIKEGISSPYYSLIFKALDKTVRKKGYNMLLFSDFDDLNPLKNKKKIDGAIICCFPRIEEKIQEIKKYLPIVLLDNIASDKSLPSVTIDNFNSCSTSVEYLWSLGHRSIGFISGLLDSDVCKDRLLGYTSALNRLGAQEDKSLIFKGDYSYESGEKAGAYFASLPQPPSAIICANDSMAIGAMKLIQEKGFKIPDDISIIGFDDIEVASRVFPALTTNAAPIQEIVENAVESLLELIDGKDIYFKHLILPAKLVKRDSCTSRKN
ncbi:MAG: GntR family transcriptional regulator [Bacteroidales bacterium]|nr:GntR family transcriptional regulator [Bacteroidales bacterium]